MIGILGTYRLLPEARFPDGMDDVTSALRWIKANIHEYGGNVNGVFAIGQSAGGGHLAMALLFNELVTAETMMPALFVTVAEFDFQECLQGNQKFVRAFSKRMKYLPTYQVLPGHNHVSYCLSIGLQGDEVGPRIVEWVRDCLCTE